MVFSPSACEACRDKYIIPIREEKKVTHSYTLFHALLQELDPLEGLIPRLESHLYILLFTFTQCFKNRTGSIGLIDRAMSILVRFHS